MVYARQMSERALGWMLAGALGILVACGGRATDVPNGDGDAGSSGRDAATDSGGTTTDGGTDASAKAACRTVQDCNEDALTSPPAGECEGEPMTIERGYGVCVCRAGFHIQPDGKCGSAPLPSCTGMGGQCMQGATKCPAGMVAGSDAANMSCGDLVAAACCFEAAQCFGPFFLVCCGPADAHNPPFCESGYLTCAPPDTPGGGCG